MTPFAKLEPVTRPFASSSRIADSTSRSTRGLSEHRPFESRSGSIGSTRPGKYTDVPRERASSSSARALLDVVRDVGDVDAER